MPGRHAAPGDPDAAEVGEPADTQDRPTRRAGVREPVDGLVNRGPILRGGGPRPGRIPQLTELPHRSNDGRTRPHSMIRAIHTESATSVLRPGTLRKHALPLSERTCTCTACGAVSLRDKNSARVMLARAGLIPAC